MSVIDNARKYFASMTSTTICSPISRTTLPMLAMTSGGVPFGAKIPHQASETARRYRFDDGQGEIGIIAPVSHPFCGHCSRVRLTSDGKIRTCLFSVLDHDLAAVLRRGGSDDDGGLHLPRRRRDPDRLTPRRRELAAVIERFLALYGSINSFTRLAIKLQGRPGVLRRWSPRAGEQELL